MSFKENLAILPSIHGLARIELFDQAGTLIVTIDNQPGKQGSLAVYQYLQQLFGVLNVEAAHHGIEIFAEHSLDAKNRPGAHPNIDRLFEVAAGADALTIQVIKA